MTLPTRPKIAVSYWQGDIPENAQLHFRSFFAFNSDIEYHLYVEDCSPHSTAFLTPFIEAGQLTVITFKITDWLEAFDVPKIHVQTKLERLLSVPLQLFGWFLSRQSFRRLSRNSAELFGAWFHNEIGFTPPHTSRLSNYSTDLAYLSDLFRCLAPSVYLGCDFWYFDLDVAILKPLETQLTAEWGSYVSQWGASDFANSAILHIRGNDSGVRVSLLQNIKEGTLAKPWVIFSGESCRKLGLTIVPTRHTDPPWAPDNPFTGNSGRFFVGPPLREKEMHQVLGFHFFHWHGMWNTIPQVSSPYHQLLKFILDEKTRL